MLRSIWFKLILVGMIASFGFVAWCNLHIIQKSNSFLYNSPHDIPYHHVGLVLGTSKFLKKGMDNPYFNHRIEATVELYRYGKIKYIIVSGDNRHYTYNEPQDMREALVKQGIPDSVIFLDYAGLRTLDSVIRCKEVFGQQDFIVISQKFQNERAVYIGHQMGINIIGFNAEDVGYPDGLKTKSREVLAKVKVLIDMHITEKSPHFLGKKIAIPV